jgi:hypothetical protein
MLAPVVTSLVVMISTTHQSIDATYYCAAPMHLLIAAVVHTILQEP